MPLDAVLFVADLPRMKSFYASILGLVPESGSETEGYFAFNLEGSIFWLHGTSTKLNDAEIGTNSPRENSSTKFVFHVSLDDDVAIQVTQNGGKIMTRPWGVEFADPEGNIFSTTSQCA